MLEADSVSLTFGSGAIQSGCYINCKPAEIVGLLGRNGSGKSSLLKIIFGSLNADFKHLRINDKIIRRPAYKTRQIAYLPQDPFLPNFFTTSEILKDFESITSLNLDNALLTSLKNKKVGELSGGELRLTELIWLLKLNTPYLLLDEPFSGLSPVFVEIIQQILRQASASRGIIVTDHLYRSLIEISDRIVLLHNNAIYPIKEEDDLIRYNYVPAIISS
jgi:lipopolysaccharide export system ATP-binding protein